MERLSTTTGAELLTLTTFDPPPAPRQLTCASDPESPVNAMGEGDAVFVLRTVQHFLPDRPSRPRPAEFFASAEVKDWATCEPERMEGRWLPFEQHGRLYEAFAAQRPAFSEERRVEIEAIWKELSLSAIATGVDRAEPGRPYLHEISTHCGITGKVFDGREWIADPLLVEARDGPGPPPGWDGPTEIGTIELRADNTAVFTARYGRRSARPRAPSPERWPTGDVRVRPELEGRTTEPPRASSSASTAAERSQAGLSRASPAAGFAHGTRGRDQR